MDQPPKVESARSRYIRELSERAEGRGHWKMWLWIFGEIVIFLLFVYGLFVSARK